MNFIIDIGLPLLAFILLVISFFIKERSKSFKFLIILLGIIVLGLSIYKSLSDSEAQSEIIKGKDSLITLSINVQDSLTSIKTAIADIGLKIDERTDSLLITDSLLLRKSVLRIINYDQDFLFPQNSTVTAAIEIEQRHISDSLLIRFKKIPLSYPINILHNPDQESFNLTREIKSRLISLGYKINSVSTSLMWANSKESEVQIYIDDSKKVASVDISQQGYYSQ